MFVAIVIVAAGVAIPVVVRTSITIASVVIVAGVAIVVIGAGVAITGIVIAAGVAIVVIRASVAISSLSGERHDPGRYRCGHHDPRSRCRYRAEHIGHCQHA